MKKLILISVAVLLSCSKESPDKLPLAIVNTSDIIYISETTAKGGGNIISDGGAAVIARGLCWSATNDLPTTSDSKTSDGPGDGYFTSALSGLTGNTHYFARAYATTANGTAYGLSHEFTTVLFSMPASLVGTWKVNSYKETTNCKNPANNTAAILCTTLDCPTLTFTFPHSYVLDFYGNISNYEIEFTGPDAFVIVPNGADLNKFQVSATSLTIISTIDPADCHLISKLSK